MVVPDFRLDHFIMCLNVKLPFYIPEANIILSAVFQIKNKWMRSMCNIQIIVINNIMHIITLRNILRQLYEHLIFYATF